MSGGYLEPTYLPSIGLFGRGLKGLRGVSETNKKMEATVSFFGSLSLLARPRKLSIMENQLKPDMKSRLLMAGIGLIDHARAQKLKRAWSRGDMDILWFYEPRQERQLVISYIFTLLRFTA